MSIGRILGHAIVGGVRRKIAEAGERREKQDKLTTCCNKCGTEVVSEASACHRCGSVELTNLHDFATRKTAEKEAQKKATEPSWGIALQDAEIRQHEKKRHKEYKALRKQLKRGRLCEPCNATYDKEHLFCPTCAIETQKISPSVASSVLADQFPEFESNDS